jgi:Lipase (class 3)
MSRIKVIKSISKSFCNNSIVNARIGAAEEPPNADFMFPEPQVLYEFANNIYKGESQMQGWTFLFEIQKPCKAQLYFNEQKWQLLLVFKGTNVSHWQDLIADGRNVCWGSLRGAGDAVFTLGEEIRKFMMKFKRPPQLIITGHSLGGFYAQIAAYTIANLYVQNGEVLRVLQPHWSIHPHVVVFDSPSSFHMITEMSGENPRTNASTWIDVTNFMVAQNSVNASWYQGAHFCSLIKVLPGTQLNKHDLFYGHKLKYFKNIDLASAKSVTNIKTMHTAL